MRSKIVTGMLYGWTVIIVLMLLTSMILALFLRFTTFNEATLTWLSYPLGLFALFIGGFVAGIKSKKNGWITGIVVGGGFTVLVFLVQYLGYKQGFSLQQALHHLGFIFASLIGGVLGVNMIGSQK